MDHDIDPIDASLSEKVPSTDSGPQASFPKIDSPVASLSEKEKLEVEKLEAEISKLKAEAVVVKKRYPTFIPFLAALVNAAALAGVSYWALAPQITLLKDAMGKAQETLKQTENKAETAVIETGRLNSDVKRVAKSIGVQESRLKLANSDLTNFSQSSTLLRQEEKLRRLYERFVANFNGLESSDLEVFFNDANDFHVSRYGNERFQDLVNSVSNDLLSPQEQLIQHKARFWAFLFAQTLQKGAFAEFNKYFNPKTFSFESTKANPFLKFPKPEFASVFSKLEQIVISGGDVAKSTLSAEMLERLRGQSPEYVLSGMLHGFRYGCGERKPDPSAANRGSLFSSSSVPVDANLQILAIQQIQQSFLNGSPLLFEYEDGHALGGYYLKLGLQSTTRQVLLRDLRFQSLQANIEGANNRTFSILDVSSRQAKDWQTHNLKLLKMLSCPAYKEVRNWPLTIRRKLVFNEWVSAEDLSAIDK